MRRAGEAACGPARPAAATGGPRRGITRRGPARHRPPLGRTRSSTASVLLVPERLFAGATTARATGHRRRPRPRLRRGLRRDGRARPYPEQSDIAAQAAVIADDPGLSPGGRSGRPACATPTPSAPDGGPRRSRARAGPCTTRPVADGHGVAGRQRRPRAGDAGCAGASQALLVTPVLEEPCWFSGCGRRAAWLTRRRRPG